MSKSSKQFAEEIMEQMTKWGGRVTQLNEIVRLCKEEMSDKPEKPEKPEKPKEGKREKIARRAA